MIGTSLLMASFGFVIHSLPSANAKSQSDEKYKMVPVNSDGTISVKLSDEQLNSIIPKNEDGSINIRLSEKQLKAIEQPPIQDINIEKVGGELTHITKTRRYAGVDYYSLGVHTNDEQTGY